MTYCTTRDVIVNYHGGCMDPDCSFFSTEDRSMSDYIAALLEIGCRLECPALSYGEFFDIANAEWEANLAELKASLREERQKRDKSESAECVCAPRP